MRAARRGAESSRLGSPVAGVAGQARAYNGRGFRRRISLGAGREDAQQSGIGLARGLAVENVAAGRVLFEKEVVVRRQELLGPEAPRGEIGEKGVDTFRREPPIARTSARRIASVVARDEN